MKTWFLILSMLAAPLAVGCASDPEPQASTEADVASDEAELAAVGPTAWAHQPIDFDCGTPVSNKFTRSSRRHVYSFPGEAGTSAKLNLAGNWAPSLGARIYVTNPAGQVIATSKASASSTVSVEVSFKVSGKHLIYVSPIKFNQINSTLGYKLAASCQGKQQLCATASVQWEGSSTATYYAQNVGSQAEAEAYYEGFPASSGFQTLTGPCDQSWACITLYKPVCGVIRNEPPTTFSNACAFSAAVRADAGGTVGEGSKGYIQSEGECYTCNYDDPALHFVAQSPKQCQLVKFACQPAQTPFFNECGCGCSDN
jgi:hypothetical protein